MRPSPAAPMNRGTTNHAPRVYSRLPADPHPEECPPMPSLRRGLSAFALLLAFALAPVAADELSDRQRKAAEANLKKGEVKKAVVVETNRFIVCATVPEAKAKVLGE